MGPQLSHLHVLSVLGTGVLAHGWSPQAEESPYPHVSPSSLGKRSNCWLSMQNMLVLGEENGMKQNVICKISECMCINIFVWAHRFGLYPFFG